MQNFGTVPALPYLGQAFWQPNNVCTPIGEEPKHATLEFFWAAYGVSQSKPDMRVPIDISNLPGGPKNIRGVFIDNTGSDGSIYVYFTDTGQTVTCAPYSTAQAPAITKGLTCEIVGKGFGTQDASRTRVFLLNTPLMPGTDAEINFVYPQYRASPQISRGLNVYSNGFASPAIGDQFSSGVLPTLNPGPATATLFNGPYANGGTITLTDIYIAWSTLALPAASCTLQLVIASNGASGTFLNMGFRSQSSQPMNNPTIIREQAGLQYKLNAAETWSISMSANVNEAASNLNYCFGYSYQGPSSGNANGVTGTGAFATVGGSQLLQQVGGLSFIAPATAQVTSCVFSQQGNAGGRSYHAEIWTDNGGSPGAQVGASSAVGTMQIGGTDLQLLFGTPVAIAIGTKYWIVLVPENIGTENTLWQVVAAVPNFTSGRAGTIPALASNLPAGNQWKCVINYQT